MTSALLLPPYLPPTGAQPSAAEQLEADDVAACATEALDDLLEADDQRFWTAASASNGPLTVFIDTYLRFAPRSLGFGSRHVNGANESPNEAMLRKRFAIDCDTVRAAYSAL